MKAALFLMERVDEDGYGKVDEDVVGDDLLSISDVPQAVFDAMSDEQRAELELAQQQVLNAIARAETVVKEAQAKVLAGEIAERRVH